jgi:hypothetical protein
MCVCVSTTAGMTVFPVKLTRVAPAGTVTCPRLPTWVMRLLLTTNAASSIGSRPSPRMSLAPSNTAAPPV